MANTVTETSVHEEATMCTKKEKLGHALGVLGHDSAYTLWATWATPFMTDILALPAAFLGALLAGARIFDAFTDISMGSLLTAPEVNGVVSVHGYCVQVRCFAC